MSDRRDTQQEEIVRGEGEEGDGAAQVEEQRREEGGEEVDGPARPREDDQIEQQQRQQQGVPQGPDQQQEAARWYKKKIRKAKNLFLFPFRKVKKFYSRRCRGPYYYYGDDPGGCCCRCFRPPPAISPPRLTNPANLGRRNPSPSSYEFVKFLIESNDFYAPQCNVHGNASMPT